MPTYNYTPYYHYNGPTHSQPFREELSAEQVEENKNFFLEKLEGHFAGTDAVVGHNDAGTAFVITTLPEDKCDEITKGLLNYLDLFARKSKEP